MTYATIRISSTSRQPRRGERQLPERHYGPPRPAPGRARRGAAGTSCTRKSRAPRSHASAHAVAVAPSRASSGRPVTAPRNRLRDGPTSTGRPERLQRVELVEQQDDSARRSSRSRSPGSTTVASGATPAARRRGERAPQLGEHLADHVARTRRACRRRSRGSVRASASGSARRRPPRRRAPCAGSSRSAETSLIAAAPASSAARATSALTVSTVSTQRGWRRTSASTTGSTRASSTSAGTGSVAARTGGLAADVEDGGAGLEQRVGVRQRRVERRRSGRRR